MFKCISVCGYVHECWRKPEELLASRCRTWFFCKSGVLCQPLSHLSIPSNTIFLKKSCAPNLISCAKNNLNFNLFLICLKNLEIILKSTQCYANSKAVLCFLYCLLCGRYSTRCYNFCVLGFKTWVDKVFIMYRVCRLKLRTSYCSRVMALQRGKTPKTGVLMFALLSGMIETAQVDERAKGNGASQGGAARRGVQIIDDEPQAQSGSGGCCSSG